MVKIIFLMKKKNRRFFLVVILNLKEKHLSTQKEHFECGAEKRKEMN